LRATLRLCDFAGINLNVADELHTLQQQKPLLLDVALYLPCNVGVVYGKHRNVVDKLPTEQKHFGDYFKK
jgi:hypothetical protein